MEDSFKISRKNFLDKIRTFKLQIPKIVIIHPHNFTWRELFMKLDFEELLSTFNYNPDFKKFYKILHSIKGTLTSLIIPIIKC